MPRWTHKLHLRLRSLFHKSRVERELSEELLFHLERMMEERVANGKAPDEAGYAALRELGGMEQIKEQCRDMRRVNYIENLIQDIRYGIRMLAKNPGFTVIAVLTLALGIGANTAIFSVVYGVIFRPLPYRDPDRLVTLWTNWLEKPGSRSAVSLPDFRDWESQNSVFEGLAAYGYNRYDIPDLEDGGSVRAAMVTADFFPLLGVKPLLGREIVAADERERVGVLSYALWQRLYHGDRNAIGRSLRLRERPITII
ncbi:MAG TPA: ABC transporter permease, partial [Acidobacteriota bacterium]|nr:ABC transporter permease [Acidobacteriota bacterium]